MNKNWLKQIRAGVKPSTLFAQEMSGNEDCGSNEIIEMFLEEILSEGNVGPGFDVLEIHYPIWNWEKPDKSRKNGISAERMDARIIEIMKKWNVLEQD